MEQKETPYIMPNLYTALSFQKLQDDFKKYGSYMRLLNDDSPLELGDIFKQELTFVVAEPGQGKSRLLRELAKYTTANDQTALFLDLKARRTDETIQDFVARSSTSDNSADASVILLDGLDEVPSGKVLSAVEHIKAFVNETPTTKVVIASRIYFFAKFEHQFASLQKAQYLLVEPLELRQAKKMLLSLGVSEPDIKRLIESLRFNRDVSTLVIQNPRYLEMLAKQININPTLTENFNRATLFENFIRGALLVEDTKSGRQLAAFKTRFLEKLALAMEIGQRNSITEDELMTFIDEARSDVKVILINQITVEDLYEHSLLKNTDGEVGFTNVEIQEYLAARAILRLKDPERNVFDIAIEPIVREPFPSWFNTLSFLIDEMPSIATRLLDIPRSLSATEDEAWHRLITGSTSAAIANEDKARIYRRVTDYYRQRHTYFGRKLPFNLANYASEDQIKELVDYILNINYDSDDVLQPLVNNIILLEELIALQKLSKDDSFVVKAKLIEVALKCKNPILVHNALGALRDFNDEDVIEQLASLINHDDQLVRDTLQGLATSINPNNTETVKIFIEGLKRERSSHARSELERLTEPPAIEQFLKAVADDHELLSQIVEHNNIYLKHDLAFLRNVKKAWDDSWLSVLKKIVNQAFDIDSGYYAQRSDFIYELIKMIVAKDSNYFEELLNDILDGERKYIIFQLSDVLAEIMKLSDLSVLINKMSQLEEGQHLPFQILSRLHFSDNPDKNAIETAGRQKLLKLYKDFDAQLADSRKRQQTSPLALEFANRYKQLTDGSDDSVGNLLKTISMIADWLNDTSSRKEKLNYTEAQIETLWRLGKEKILDVFDPADGKVTLTGTKDNRNKQFTITRYLDFFALVVRFGSLTNRTDLANYKTKIVSFIPFSFRGDVELLLKTIDRLSNDDRQSIIDVYSDANSDKASFMPENLIEVSENYQIKEAVPLLNGLVHKADLVIHHRVKALEVAEMLVPSRERLQKIFDTYSGSKEEDFQLAQRANGMLIIKHKDTDAFNWLMRYITDNTFEHVSKTGGFYEVSSVESEIHDGTNIAPLKDCDDLTRIQDYLSLLEHSFKVFERGLTWQNYAVYIWGAITQYFINLAAHGSYEPIHKLEDFVESYPNKTATANFVERIPNIKRQYLEAISKPKTFTEAVTKLNDINSRNYLPISSTEQLYDFVKDVVDSDLRTWTELEGYKLLQGKEIPVQKNLLVQIENILLKKGFQNEDIRRGSFVLLREAQALDDTRTDIMVYYGFYGPIVIEIKRADHDDLKGKLETKESHQSLQGYMQKFGASKGIFLVYDDVDRSKGQSWKEHLKKIRAAYEKISGISVIGLKSVEPVKPSNSGLAHEEA